MGKEEFIGITSETLDIILESLIFTSVMKCGFEKLDLPNEKYTGIATIAALTLKMAIDNGEEPSEEDLRKEVEKLYNKAKKKEPNWAKTISEGLEAE